MALLTRRAPHPVDIHRGSPHRQVRAQIMRWARRWHLNAPWMRDEAWYTLFWWARWALDSRPAGQGLLSTIWAECPEVLDDLRDVVFTPLIHSATPRGDWPAYNRALVRRGDVTLWVSSEAIAAWTPRRSGRRGGQRRYSDLAIETALTLRLLYHLPLYTRGFGEILEGGGVQPIRLPPKSPNLNAVCRAVRPLYERGVSQSRRPPRRRARASPRGRYVEHDHRERNHQGLDNQLLQRPPPTVSLAADVQRRERLGGLLNFYHREAA